MSTKRPAPIAARRPAPLPVRRPTPTSAPEADVPPVEAVAEEDAFGAFEEVAPAAPAAPARKAAPVTPTGVKKPAPIAAPARKVAPKPVGAAAPAETGAKYGTSGMPEATRVATGAKGSEVFGVQPPKSDGPPQASVVAPKKQVAQGAAAKGGPASGGVIQMTFGSVEEAIAFIKTTNGVNYVNLSEPQKEGRDYALRLWVTDLLAKFGIISEVVQDAAPEADFGPLIPLDDLAQIVNTNIEATAGAAPAPAKDETLTAPTGAKVTLSQLIQYIMDYATATPKSRADIDRYFGTELGKWFAAEIKVIATAQETAARSKAHSIAVALVETWSQPEGDDPGTAGGGEEAPEEDGEGQEFDEGAFDAEAAEGDEDDEDDGSEPEAATPTAVVRQFARRGGASAPAPSAGPPDEARLKFEFEGDKVALKNRAAALICGNCKLSVNAHKGLKGATKFDCAGFVPANKPAAQEWASLMRDTAAFKEKYATLLAPPKSDSPEPLPRERGGVEVGGRVGHEGGVGRATAPAAAVGGGHGARGVGDPSPKRPGGGPNAGRPDEGVGQVQEPAWVDDREGPVEDEVGGVSGPESAAGAGGTFSGGDESTPDGYRAARERERTEWAAASGGEFTSKLTWAINYPPRHPNTVAAPTSLALDQASVTRRDDIVPKVEGYITRNLFDGQGQLRDDVEYGSPGWRAFVAGRRLAAAVEKYVAARRPEETEPAQNAVQRAAKDYVTAHYLLPEGTPDPQFDEYVEMCVRAQRPIGTPIEELMGQQG